MEPTSPVDPAEAESLLAAVVDRLEASRRYRSLREWTDSQLWPQALAAGDALRQGLRSGGASGHGLKRLRAVLASAEAAIAREQQRPAHQALVTAWLTGDDAAVARGITGVFAGLSPAPAGTRAFVGITLRDRGRTLVPASEVARRIAGRLAGGLAVRNDAPPLTPLVLDSDPASVNSPVMLEHALDGQAWQGFVDDERGDLLVFARRIPGPWTVLCADAATDEWWEADPQEYAAYRDSLRAELASNGVKAHLLCGAAR